MSLAYGSETFSENQHAKKHDSFMQAIPGSDGKSCTLHLHSGKNPLAIATSLATLAVPSAGMFSRGTSSSIGSSAAIPKVFEPNYRLLNNVLLYIYMYIQKCHDIQDPGSHFWKSKMLIDF